MFCSFLTEYYSALAKLAAASRSRKFFSCKKKKKKTVETINLTKCNITVEQLAKFRWSWKEWVENYKQPETVLSNLYSCYCIHKRSIMYKTHDRHEQWTTIWGKFVSHCFSAVEFTLEQKPWMILLDDKRLNVSRKVRRSKKTHSFTNQQKIFLILCFSLCGFNGQKTISG